MVSKVQPEICPFCGAPFPSLPNPIAYWVSIPLYCGVALAVRSYAEMRGAERMAHRQTDGEGQTKEMAGGRVIGEGRERRDAYCKIT